MISRSTMLLGVFMAMVVMSSIEVEGRTNSIWHSSTDQELVDEINLARTQPRRYARVLADLRQYYQGDVIRMPGEIAVQTREGVSAVDEAIRFLRAVEPVPALARSQGMSRAAQDHVADQGPSGLVGHRGTDHSSPGQRLNRYGEWR